MRPTFHSNTEDCTGNLKQKNKPDLLTHFPIMFNYKQTQRIIGSKSMFVIAGKITCFLLKNRHMRVVFNDTCRKNPRILEQHLTNIFLSNASVQDFHIG
jgi:hypothetical protein